MFKLSAHKSTGKEEAHRHQDAVVSSPHHISFLQPASVKLTQFDLISCSNTKKNTHWDQNDERGAAGLHM